MLFKGILYANGATFLLPIRSSLHNITKSHDLKIKRELLTLYTHMCAYIHIEVHVHTRTGSLYIFILLKMYREKLLYYMVNVFDGIMAECWISNWVYVIYDKRRRIFFHNIDILVKVIRCHILSVGSNKNICYNCLLCT